MSLNDLTIGQAREPVALFNGAAAPSVKAPHPLIGQYVIARCHAAGVHAGTVESVDGENVILRDSTRLWSWKAVDGVALSGVAQHGIDRAKSKLDTTNPLIYLTGVCELIPCSRSAEKSIRG